ncbi:hypothetical protein GQR58_001367 [Nymphon striatum]|nr:hypothetical protein GQR58_001367 [Nymphon striatum]
MNKTTIFRISPEIYPFLEYIYINSTDPRSSLSAGCGSSGRGGWGVEKKEISSDPRSSLSAGCGSSGRGGWGVDAACRGSVGHKYVVRGVRPGETRNVVTKVPNNIV